MARVLLENVTKIFDSKIAAVDNVSLDIADKEFMVIVGPSGCGKTTTLRMIAGLENPTSGTIAIGNQVVNEILPKDRDIAMVFQNYALYPHMRVFDNIAFGLKLRKTPKTKIEKSVDEVVNLLNIKHLLKRKPQALSGGQRQRVALARAIVREPKVFLFDEPLSNLDAQLRITTRAELKSLQHKLQTTTIYVTHDQAEAMTLGDRICVMYDGVIQQVAKPMEVYKQPVNKFVAGFLGTPPMNFFEGRIDFEADKPKFIMNDIEIALPTKLRDSLSSYKGKEISLGIRPEHLSMRPIEGQDRNKITATVDIVEPLGNRKELYLTTKSGQKFIASIASHMEVKPNDEIKVHIDIDRLHIFEQDNMGKNVILLNERIC